MKQKVPILATVLSLVSSVSSEYANKVDAFANKFQRKLGDTLGVGGEGMVGKIISIAVGMIVVAAVFPTALNQLADADIPSSMSTVGTLLKTLLPILAVIGIIMYIYKRS